MKKLIKRITAFFLALCTACTFISFEAMAAEVTHDSRFADYTIQHGIDVSVYQGSINWTKVKNDGIDFAFIRIGYRGYGSSGTLCRDTKASENIAGALAAGLDVGVYFYSQATSTTEAKEEANFAISLLKEYGYSSKDLALPVVIDFEYASAGDGLTGRLYNYYKANTSTWKSNATSIVMKFCSVVEASGYTGMVYAGKSMLNSMNAEKIYASYPIWLAHYTTKTDYTGYYDYWQYSSKGSVKGISGNVDMDYRYMDSAYKLTVSSKTSTGLTLTWKQIALADGYYIYRKNSSGKSEELIATLEGAETTTYKDKSLSTGTEYTYRVVAYSNDASGTEFAYSSTVTACTKIPNTTLNISTVKYNCVKLKWTKVSGATGYQLQRYKSGSWVAVSKPSASTTSYTITDLTASTKYKFRLRAYKKVGDTTIYSTYQTLTATTSELVKGTVKADKAYAYSKASKSSSKLKTLKLGKLVKITGTSGNYYKAQLTVSGKTKTCYIPKSKITIIAKPELTAAASTTVGKVNLSWGAVSSAEGYEIQQYNASKGEWKTVKTIKSGTTESCAIKDLNTNVTYKFRIRAYTKVNGKKLYGGYTSSVKVTTSASVKGTTIKNTAVYSKADSKSEKLATFARNTYISLHGSRGDYYRVYVTIDGTPKIAYVKKANIEITKAPELTVAATKNPGELKLTWKKISGAAGYKIEQYDSTLGEWQVVKTLKDGTVKTYTFSNLKSGKNYKYRIRAYKTINGKTVYGTYTSSVKAKTI